MATEPKQPPMLFLCYAQKDEAFKQEFEDYLVILQQSQLITGWTERQVQRGTDWFQAIDPHVFLADFFIVLVSPGLLASGYCSGAEFREVFERNMNSMGPRVLPIILHAVSLRGSPFESVQCMPRNGKPVSSWPERYEAWRSVDREIRYVLSTHSWGHL